MIEDSQEATIRATFSAIPFSPALTEAQQAVFTTLLLELIKWNDHYNLTAVREPEAMVIRHIYDSLSIAPFMHGQNILDVGTGPGFPGLPLAILMPDKKFTLLDSNGKKTRFLHHVSSQLGLKNVSIVHERVESYRPVGCFDSIVTRAYSEIAQMLLQTQHLCCPGGDFFAMKGLCPEPLTLPPGFQLQSIEPLIVPGLEEARHVIAIGFA